MKAFMKRIEGGAKELGVPVSRLQAERMAIHGKELMAWSEVANITAIRDTKELAEKQFLDVFPILKEVPPKAKVLDMGSGGGFPGLPLKIMRLDLNVTLIDGTRKKVSFLRHVIRTIGIEGVEARHVRAEDLHKKKDEGGGGYDIVISKAVGDLMALVNAGLPLLNKGGMLFALKGMRIDKELQGASEIAALHSLSVRTKKYRLPFSGIERTLVVFEK